MVISSRIETLLGREWWFLCRVEAALVIALIAAAESEYAITVVVFWCV